MTMKLEPLQTLFLWRLLASGGGEFLKVAKPELKPAKVRRQLKDAGLIDEQPKKQFPDRKGARASTYVSLSEQGWNWAANNLDAKMSTSSPAAGPILHAILTKLKFHLQRQNVGLVDFITASEQGDQTGGIPEGGVDTNHARPELAQRVRAAYAELADGRADARVRLADLRQAMADVDRTPLDGAILAMEREQAAVLYPFDNPLEIRPEDETAALPNRVGRPRHVIYMIV